MKILIDLTSLADNLSGIERYAMNIAENLINIDVNESDEFILIFKNHIHPTFSIYKNTENVTCKIFKGKNKLLFNQLTLPLSIYREKADRYIFPAFPSPLIFRKKGIYNLIADLTCWDCPETMNWKSRLFFKVMIYNAVNVSTGIITISNFTKQRIQEKFKKIKNSIIVAYCGISEVFLNNKIYSEKDKMNIYKKYSLPGKYLLCVSTLEPRKNLPFLVKAYLELMKEKKINISLVLAGRRGWKIDKFINQIEEKYQEYITITGFIEEEDLPIIYKMAECFIFPSIYEGFGMPPLEALAAGTPVISSDTAALPEVMGNACQYFRSNDINSLKNEICKFFSQSRDCIIRDTDCIDFTKFDWKQSAIKIRKSL